MPQDREIIFEFQTRGSVVKVTAIDSHTGREVSIVGPAKAAKTDLKQLALRKLQYVLAKENP